MKDANRLHLWMIIPLVLVQITIGSDYWLQFPDSPWSVHVHFFTMTVWYILLITQPYLVVQGNLAQHRTVGIIGFAMAGGVAFTAMSMLPNTVGFGRYVEANPGAIGAFTPEFFYAIALSESFLVCAFLYAVYKAIQYRASKQEHATWLVSTAFIMLYPAVGRGVQNAAIMIKGFDNYFIEIVVLPAAISAATIIGVTLLVAYRFAMLRHPAIHLAIGINLIPLFFQSFPEIVGMMSEWIKAVFMLRFEGTKF